MGKHLTAICLLGLVGIACGATELTAKDFDDVIFNSGKNSFVKFLAPW